MRDLKEGFYLEEPSLFVPWTISEYDFTALLGFRQPTRLFRGSYWVNGLALQGLPLNLRFHFEDYQFDRMELRLCNDKLPFEESFPLMQKHIEATYGPPSVVYPVPYYVQGPHSSCEWEVGEALVLHTVNDYHDSPYGFTSIYTAVGRRRIKR